MSNYSSWLHPDVTSGNGDATVNVGADAHTGRLVRGTTMIFSAANCKDVPVVCNQTGAVEAVSMSGSASAAKAGATVTVTGRSNSSLLNFSLSNNNIPLTLPDTYIAGGLTTKNNVAIAGDPGATQEYAFSIAFTVAANEDVASKTSQLIVTDNAGNTATCTITQAAGDAFLTITPTAITIPASGAAQAVTVDSNTSWNLN